jgi:hypothetical protein
MYEPFQHQMKAPFFSVARELSFAVLPADKVVASASQIRDFQAPHN